MSRRVAKQVLEQAEEPRQDEELEELKRGLRERARAIAERERGLDRRERKLAQHERRLGRRLRLHRAERSWFAPVQRKISTDEGLKLDRATAALTQREEKASAREAEAESLAGELAARKAALERSEVELETLSSELRARERERASATP